MAPMTNHTTDRVLHVLFCLSRDTRHIDATELARAVGVSATTAAHSLLQLERAGLVDASRARLTMLGLARAVALAGQSGGGPAVDLSKSRPRTPPTTEPLAAAGDRSEPTPAQPCDSQHGLSLSSEIACEH